MREQRQSETFRHGEGKTHKKAKDRLRFMLIAEGWEVIPDADFSVFCYLDDKNLTHAFKQYYHEFDIYAKKEHSKGRYGTRSELIVEIDGSSHEKKKQQNRDRTAEEYAAFFLPDCVFRRIDISILLNPNIADKNILDLLK